MVIQGLVVSGLHAAFFNGGFLIYRRLLVGKTSFRNVSRRKAGRHLDECRGGGDADLSVRSTSNLLCVPGGY